MEEYYEKDKKIVSCYTRMVEAKQEADKATSLEVYENAFWGLSRLWSTLTEDQNSKCRSLDKAIFSLHCAKCGDNAFMDCNFFWGPFYTFFFLRVDGWLDPLCHTWLLNRVMSITFPLCYFSPSFPLSCHLNRSFIIVCTCVWLKPGLR